MEKKIIKKLKLKKEIKLYLFFLIATTLQLTGVIEALKQQNYFVLIGELVIIDIIFYILMLANKEK